MDATANILSTANELYGRADSDPNTATRPSSYKAVGISLAIASGCFIGVSFVLKKMGLLKANAKYNEEAGEGYGYLKNAYWWTGMTLMIIGEICNFVAYAFVDAILVTPLGALSVVITTILSAIFLKERLSFVGKIGCFLCIIGAVVIVMNAPAESSAATIQEMKSFVIAPGFLSYAGVVIVGCVFIALWAGPRYGKKSMLVYLSICSLIGGLSVVATQGLGAAVVTQVGGTPQFNQWFLYVLLVFVVATLVTEIIYLNKALNIFNAALVTPTYYVFFTSSTIVTSAILFRGFKGTPTSITTVVMGFLEICAGVVLLQLSKSAKDVPDAAVFAGDLDQVRTVAEQEQPESEPKADAIRGTAAIIRRISMSRQKMEAAEAKKVHEDRMKDQMEPIGENEQVEWDGLRRRKTVIGPGASGSLHRRKTLHPPLGLTYFPTDDAEADDEDNDPTSGGSAFGGSFLDSVRRRAQSTLIPGQHKNLGAGTPAVRSPMHPVALTEISVPAGWKGEETPSTAQFPPHPEGEGAMEMRHVYGLRPSLQHDGAVDTSYHAPQHATWAADVVEPSPRLHPASGPGSGSAERPSQNTKRQFSFQNVFHHHNKKPASPSPSDFSYRPSSRKGLGGSRQGSKEHGSSIPGLKSATEEERLGLVKGDSHAMGVGRGEFEEEGEGEGDGDGDDDDGASEIDWGGVTGSFAPPILEEREPEPEPAESEARKQRWRGPEGRNVLLPRGRGDGGGGGGGGGLGSGGGAFI